MSFNKNMIGHVVQYVLNNELVFWGIAEYATVDGWVGIRQFDGSLDEAQVKFVIADPT